MFVIENISFLSIVQTDTNFLYLKLPSTSLKPWTTAKSATAYIALKNFIASLSLCGLSTSDGFRRTTIFILGYDIRRARAIKGSASTRTMGGADGGIRS